MSNYNSLKELIAIDSPSGFTENATQYVVQLLQGYGLTPKLTNKGAVVCNLGKGDPKLSIAAHTDTLGTMVSGINANGTLSFTTIGGLSLNSAEGEYVRIYTHSGRVYQGTILLNNPSTHANKDYRNPVRTLDNMHIRLDEQVNSKEDINALGIDIGDFACLYTNYEELESGYIKSRFLDNKAGCYVLFELAKYFSESNFDMPVQLYFSNYEEVGHGAAILFQDSIGELLVIDMGVVGDACQGDELNCSICAKDSSGPYDYTIRKNLTDLAKKNNIPYKVDVYPFYGSDGSAAQKAGNNLRIGLIGPGVAASHGNERTHKKGIEATIQLCIKYIENSFSE